MKVSTDDLQTVETDGRGRACLGTEYADKRVTVAVVGVREGDSDERELVAAYRDAADSGESLATEWTGVSTEAWNTTSDAETSVEHDE